MPKKNSDASKKGGESTEPQSEIETPKPKRPPVKPEVKLAVWVAAGGRCTFCNSYLLENEDLGEVLSYGELAHNAGWGKSSPRGNSALSEAEREQPENFLLMCRNCHKVPDKNSNEERYSEEVLKKFKTEHEKRIRFLTGIGADKKATILRVIGKVRALNPALTYATVLEATTSEQLFPTILSYSHRNEVELDLRDLEEDDFQTATRFIDKFVRRVSEGIANDEISRLAVFGFARMPVLVYLGARLDDKIETRVFQRQRIDDKNAWRWPEQPPVAPAFETQALQTPTPSNGVAVIINISGSIKLSDLPEEMQKTFTVYEIAPKPPLIPEPTIISSPKALANYELALRLFLSKLESEHGKLDALSVFQAAPVSAAITLGRVLMPNVSPALKLYERDQQDKFYLALEVKR